MDELSRREMLKLMSASAVASTMMGFPHVTLGALAAQDGCEMDWTPTYPAFEGGPYDPPIEISVPYGVDATWVGDDTWRQNPMHQRVLENTGIDYTIAWQAVGAERNTRFATDIASGTLPDMFARGGTDLSLLVENGAVEDITDIFEATASDLVKEKKQYPDGDNWVGVTFDGRIYGVAFTYGPGYNVDNLGYIRQDWLDQLGLPMPTTLDELTETIRAFNEAGLCQYGINACQNLVTWYQSLDPIFGAFGTMPGRWLANDDGTLRYGSIDPQVKDALGVIRGWYEEGLMDPDFFTYSEGDSAGNVGAEKVGVFFAPWWIGGGLVRNLYEQVEGSQLSIMPAPIGPNGQQGRAASGTRGVGACFRAGLEPEKIEAAIKHLNWQMELHVNWEQYQQYGAYRNDHGFFQGYAWEFGEDCELVPGPTFPVATYVYVNEIGFSFPWVCYPDYQADVVRDMAAWLEQDMSELNKAQRFIVDNPATQREIVYYNTVVDTLDQAIKDQYLGPTTENMTQYMPDLDAMQQSVFAEIIIGSRPLDDFDQFVEDWKAQGGDIITEEVNAWAASRM